LQRYTYSSYAAHIPKQHTIIHTEVETKTISSSTMQPYSYAPKELVKSYDSMKENGGWWDSSIDNSTDNSKVPKEQEAAQNGDDDTIIVAAVQLTGSGLARSDIVGYCQRAEQAVIDACTGGTSSDTKRAAQMVLLPELFCGPYFCQSIHNDLFDLADPIYTTNGDGTVMDNILIQRMQYIAKLYNVVLPISIYEKFNNIYYNTVVMIDNDGSIVGIPYRKSHIPNAVGYHEKFYFSPGDSGLQVYDTAVGKIGVGICWDQWFPEVARILVLKGAELLVYPTAIGNEPEMPEWDSSMHWQRVMQGHSASNFVPVIAANRYGTEILLNDFVDDDSPTTEQQRMTFYGKSFITDYTGDKIAEVVVAPEDGESLDDGESIRTKGYSIITAPIHMSYNQKQRRIFGCFRDRRPDLYHSILSMDGVYKPSSK
jgi:N-carbamoylputrescine amidase